MNIEKIELDDIFITGIRIPLSTSLSKNQQVCMDFWKTFNAMLQRLHRKHDSAWVKYALTIKSDEGYFYYCGVPSQNCYPSNFTIYRIPRGTYLKIQHIGPMSKLKDSIQQLFKEELPLHNIEKRDGDLVYYELYKEGFLYEEETSIIEIYVPIKQSQSHHIPTIAASSILSGKAPTSTSYGQFSWFGMDYNMNLYKGCCHGCIYCDSRSSCYKVKDFDIVHQKKDALSILEMELRKKQKRGTIGIGAMSDSYNPYEKDLRITRGALKLIKQYGFGVGIDTKSDLILRDLDLLKDISKQYPSIIKMSITCADDALSTILEPNVTPSSKRFKAIQQMSEEGLFVGILLMPILPFINDNEENILKIVQLAHLHKAHFIFVYGSFGVTLRDNQRDYFYYQLDRQFPGLREQYERYYHNVYSCDSPHSKKLYNLFKRECKKYGILYKMSDIIHAYKKHLPNQQLTLHL